MVSVNMGLVGIFALRESGGKYGTVTIHMRTLGTIYHTHTYIYTCIQYIVYIYM